MEVACSRFDDCCEFDRRLSRALNLANQSGDRVHATFSVCERPKSLQLAFVEESQHHPRDQAAFQRQFIAIDRNAWRKRQLGFIVDRGREQMARESAEQEYRKSTPNTSSVFTVEQRSGDDIEQRSRRCEVKNATGPGTVERLREALDEALPIVAKDGS